MKWRNFKTKAAARPGDGSMGFEPITRGPAMAQGLPLSEVQGRIRDVREGPSKQRPVLDQGEPSEVDIQDDIALALIEMKADTLNRIDVALRRISDNTYGVCVDCGGEIAERRMRALPVAVRCKDCEDARETAEHRERVMTRRGSSSLAVATSS